MKKSLFLFSALLLSLNSFSQKESILSTSPEYRQAKLNGTIENYQVKSGTVEVMDVSQTLGMKKKPSSGVPAKASGCLSYSAPIGYTATGIISDDQATALISLPFDFCFYGDIVNALYINSNGNVTFNAPMISYSSTAFPSLGDQIIAPFWGDVDVTGGLGTISYEITATHMIINWNNVGYFPSSGDKRNNFSLVLTDGNDPIISGGNVAFLYGDMQWTTGSASGGTGGFGGIPATAGANKGDNINYFLIARFDHAGSDFDGALGGNDGISWLDNREFYFDFCSTDNVAPVPLGIGSCDTVRICSLGDTADIPFIFLSPEATQSTTITVTSATLTTLQVLTNVPGNTATASLRIIGTPAMAGTHFVNVTATDDYSTPGVTSVDFTVIIDDSGAASFNPILSPTVGCDSVVVNVLNGPYESYLWDDFTSDTSMTLNNSTQNYGVTVKLNGCYKRVTNDFTVINLEVNFNNVDFYSCPGSTENVKLVDSATLVNATWGSPSLNGLYSVHLLPGNYTVTITDVNGCTADSSFTITTQPKIVLAENPNVCGDSIGLSGNLGVSGGIWSLISGPGTATFYPNSTLQTSVKWSVPGVYTIKYAEPNCLDADTITLNVTFYPYSEVGNVIGCLGTPEKVEAYSYWDNVTAYEWSNGDTGPSTTLTEPGYYYLNSYNSCGVNTWNFNFEAHSCEINMPNVFTPNGDLVNLFYYPIDPDTKAFTAYNCKLFNRWGNIMFESNDLTKGWDGKTSTGAIAEDGVYFYLVNATNLDGLEIEKQGFFQLFGQ
ncbi:MAG: nidogen-like domain-containing protein [Crocinitomicaceae bacterium]